jgi:hypothetical protein
MAKEQDPKIQGEGDYEAARRHRKRVNEYIENNDVEKAALRAAPESAREAQAMEQAEEEGKERSKGEDPAIRRREAPNTEPSTRGKTSRH